MVTADRLSALIQLPTVDGAAEEEFITTLAELYPRVHSDLERIPVNGRALLFRWPGSDPDLPPVVLMAHYDVVPAPPADWDREPFCGTIDDTHVHGRGALDDKGPLVCLLDAVENLLTSGFTPGRDLYLALGGDEETTGDGGRAIAESFRDRGIHPDFVLDEGGAVVDAPLSLVTGRHAMIGITEKGVATLELRARGTGGHSSVPPRLTAASRVARAVTRLTPGIFPARAPVAVTGMLRALAQQASPRNRRILQTLAASATVAGQAMLRAGDTAASLVRTTIATTMLSGGSAANVLPDDARAVVNLRIAVGESLDSVIRRVRRAIRDDDVTVTVLEGHDPSPEAPVDTAGYRAICAAIAESHPDVTPVPYLVMAMTDARHWHTFTPNVYRYAPLFMSNDERRTIHGANERVRIAELDRGVQFYTSLIRNSCS